MYADKQIVLYEYQPSRKADHPMEFLKNFSGVCVTDGYQVYHTIEKEREDLKIAGCWAMQGAVLMKQSKHSQIISMITVLIRLQHLLLLILIHPPIMLLRFCLFPRFRVLQHEVFLRMLSQQYRNNFPLIPDPHFHIP